MRHQLGVNFTFIILSLLIVTYILTAMQEAKLHFQEVSTSQSSEGLVYGAVLAGSKACTVEECMGVINSVAPGIL